MDQTNSSSHLVHAVIASGALTFAAALSAGDRGPVDYVVLAAITGMLMWSLLRLGRRLHAHGGAKAV